MVSWLKDGQPLDTKRVNIRNSDKDSIMFIRSAQREDSGVYEMAIKVDSFEDKANITLQIVGELHLQTVCLHSNTHIMCVRLTCKRRLISDLRDESAQLFL